MSCLIRWYIFIFRSQICTIYSSLGNPNMYTEMFCWGGTWVQVNILSPPSMPLASRAGSAGGSLESLFYQLWIFGDMYVYEGISRGDVWKIQTNQWGIIIVWFGAGAGARYEEICGLNVMGTMHLGTSNYWVDKWRIGQN